MPDTIFEKDYIYLILGILVLIIALIFHKTLGSRPVTLNLDKIGFQLNADRLTLFFLFGFIIIGVGIFFKFKGYENRLSTFEKALNNEASSKATLEDLKKKLAEYEMNIILEFDESIDVNPLDLKYWIKGKFGGNPNTAELVTPEFSPIDNAPKFKFEGIKQGDKFQIIAKKSNVESWISEEIEIPKTIVKIK